MDRARLGPYTLGVAAHLLLLLAWYLFVTLGEVPKFVMPSPGDTLRALFQPNYDWWRNLEVAFKYAGSDEAEGLGIPQTRYGVALNQEIFDNTILSMGYLHDTFDDDLLDNGTKDTRHSLFTQIAVEF